MENKETKTRSIRILRYGWITSNLGFFLFVAALAIIYIANGHMAHNTIREINKINREIKDLKYESKTLKSELMYKTREEAIVEMAAPTGLTISNEPLERIKTKN